MSSTDLLTKSEYGIINYDCIRILGKDTALFLFHISHLEGKYKSYFERVGFIYASVRDVQNAIQLGQKAQEKAIQILTAKGILEMERAERNKEKNGVRLFKVNKEALRKVIITEESTVYSEEDTTYSEEQTVYSEAYEDNKESNNKNNKENKKDITAVAAVSSKQSTLFSLPSLEPKKKEKVPTTAAMLKKLSHAGISERKISEAKEGIRKWEDIGLRDFTLYYITEHNKRFDKPIAYDYKGSAAAFRPFYDNCRVEREKLCELIELILDEAKLDPQSEKWGCLTFNALSNPFVGQLYLEQAKRRLFGEIRTIQNSEISEEILKKAEELPDDYAF